MSGNGGEEAPRPRPLSGGLWTLFSWLRRDERASSSDSLSSAGSDRTVLSFSFLPPVNYSNGVLPLVVPPPGPPTDSYRKRVHERNLRRQHDRNITLHRKYGLYRSDCPNGYDALSLPPARRISIDSNSKWERERRATSECFQGRIVHVPGKRRAPPPPSRAASVGPSTTLVRRTRKRPAPQPPVKRLQKIEEDNVQLNENKTPEMNPQTSQIHQLTKNNDISMGCKPEKYSKKDSNTKENKGRSEKNFLKQIFENKKRSTTIEPASVKVLPSISELDKQAAEIIKTNKENGAERNNNITSLNLSITKSQGSSGSSMGDYWFCIICLRKYDSTIADCLYCSQKQKSPCTNLQVPSSSKNFPLTETTIYTQTDNALTEKSPSRRANEECKVEDKQKLKEMLKEMKDSLPKRLKHGLNNNDLEKTKNKDSVAEIGDKSNHVFETPTLRIGTVTNTENTSQSSKENISTKEESGNVQTKTGLSNNVLITKQVVIESSALNSNKVISEEHKLKTNSSKCNSNALIQPENMKKKLIDSDIVERKHRDKLNTPLKISSLLNPIYISKDNNKVGSNPLESVLSHNKLNKTVTNSAKTVANVELMNKPHTVLSNLSAIIPSTTQILQAQENPKYKKDLLEKQLGITGDQNINKPAIQICKQNLLKNMPKENGELINVTVSDKDLAITDKSGTNKNTPCNNPKSPISPMEKEDMVLQKTNMPNTSDFKCNNKALENIGLNKHIVLPAIAENNKISEAKKACAEKINFMNIKADPNHTNNLSKITHLPSSSANIKDHHFQRRSLINQLEQSIAKGDERAAAEAATKLAQLRLSCSVLSFSSQIICEPTTSSNAKNISLFVPDGATPNPSDLKTSPLQSKTDLIGKTPQNKISNIAPSISAAQILLQRTKPLPTTASTVAESLQTSILQPSASKQHNDLVSIKVWVEDRESARGPIHLRVNRRATMGNLRNEAEASLGLARHLQRWIVGKTLCTDDNALLANVAGEDFGAPIYLCLVESEINKNKMQEKNEKSSETTASNDKKESGAEGVVNFYTELVQLEQQALVPNAEPFECGICMEESARGGGAVLRDCVHTFCKQCLSDLVLHCEEPIIPCPAMGCHGILEEREIRALVSPEEYERWLARGLNAAESGTRNAFHCRTRDCTGWALCEPGVRRFPCPVCKHTNCVPCQAIHEGQTCEEFQTKLKKAANDVEGNQTDDDTRALLNTLIKRGEALECPECKAIITKKWGCDWIKCSACKTEICWVTRGRRWGPAGRGDTSAGCRCGVDGKRCHPSCGYCH